MGCAFCASTVGGRVRNLTAGELLDQVIFTQKDSGVPISNIVLMGIGEPLDNYDNVRRFLTLVNHPDGVNIGMRHISLSTCGLIRGLTAWRRRDFSSPCLCPSMPPTMKPGAPSCPSTGARGGGPACGLPPVFCKNRPADLL